MSSSDEASQPTLPAPLQSLADVVSQKSEQFAHGSKDIQTAALSAVDFVFNLSLEAEPVSLPHITDFLQSLNPEAAPQTRSKAQKKSTEPAPGPRFRPFAATELCSLYTQDMDDDQIWAQLDLRAQRVSKMLETAVQEETSDTEEAEGLLGEEDSDSDEGLEGLGGDEDDDFMSSSGDEGSSSGDIEASDDGAQEDDGMLDEQERDPAGEFFSQLRDNSSGSESEEEETPSKPKKSSRAKRKAKPTKDVFGLNDNFFDIDKFNAETEAAEARVASRGSLRDDEDASDEEEEEDVDLFAPIGSSLAEDASLGFGNDAEEDEGLDAGAIFYKDFFDALPKTAKATHPKSSSVRFNDQVKVKTIKSRGKSLSLSSLYNSPDAQDLDDSGSEDGFGELDEDEDGEFGFDDDSDASDASEEETPRPSSSSKNKKKRKHVEEDEDEDDAMSENGETGLSHRQTIERLKDDLFADDDDAPTKDLTTHQKRLAALQNQIRSLEAENVGDKDWVMKGEATSRSRPKDSVLERDLEFDRNLKPTPIITTEIVQALEDRIRARILEGNFDDVVRIKLTEDKPFLPSRYTELSDTKDKDGLAKSYEDDYLASRGASNGDDRDGKLAKEHQELELQWEGICAKLDALCNAHYTPKQPKTTIASVHNVSTTNLESALPTTQSISSMLAPEEVFASDPTSLRARSEMTPAEKQAARTKERKKRKKQCDLVAQSKAARAGDVKGSGRIGNVKKDKKKALDSIVKSGKGVTIVGKSSTDKTAKKGKSRSS